MRRILTARQQVEMLLPLRRAAKPKGWQSRDPINDPNGYLDKEPFTYDDLVRRGVDHVEGATPEQHFRGRVWYPTAHDLFRDVSRRVKGGTAALSRNVTIASAYSPKTPWGRNIQQAIHFLLHYDGDPAKRHDWQSANIHPAALERFRQLKGRDPSNSPKDLNILANQHRGRRRDGSEDLPGFEVLRDPDQRAEWIDNIRTRGIDKVLRRHNLQVKSQPVEDVLDEEGNPVPKLDKAGNPVMGRNGEPAVLRVKKPYNPTEAIAHVGIPTLGGNIAKAKRIWHAAPGTWKQLLGDLKTRAFHDNIADDTPLRAPRTWAQAHKDVMDFNPGLDERESPYYHEANDPERAHQIMDDDEGYYEMPIDPETGKPNWKLSKDLRSTCDTQHSRAMTMDHGDWRKTKYEAPDALATGPGYALFDKAVYDSTDILNSKQLDPYQHLLPKQVQGIIWGKHKDENDYFGKIRGLVRQGGEKFVPPVRKPLSLKGKSEADVHPNYTNDWNESDVELDDSARKGVPNWEAAPNYELEDPDAAGPLESHKDRAKRLRSGSIHHDEEDFPWDWENCLNGWIARHYPHRAHPSWLERTATRIGRTFRDPLLASVAEALYYSAAIEKSAIHDDIEDRPEWGHQLWEHVMRHPDGMTLKDDIGDGPDSGQMVSHPKEEVQRHVPFYMLLPEDLHGYAVDFKDRINADPDDYMGGWRGKAPKHDPDSALVQSKAPHYYLDVSHNQEDPWLSTHDADHNEQDALYDLGPTGIGEAMTEDAMARRLPEQDFKFWLGNHHD